MAQEYCNCCERPLTGTQTVWLVYDNTAGRYYPDHADIPEGHEDLGGFPFGKTCARKALSEGEAA